MHTNIVTFTIKSRYIKHLESWILFLNLKIKKKWVLLNRIPQFGKVYCISLERELIDLKSKGHPREVCLIVLLKTS